MDGGKVVQRIGWVMFAAVMARYAYAFYDIVSDPSVSAYAFLVILEGMFYLCMCLLVVWVGGRLNRAGKSTEPPPEDQ